MNISLKYVADESMAHYFFKVFILAVIPAYFVSSVIEYFFPYGKENNLISSFGPYALVWKIILIGLVSPFIETAFLIYPSVISTQIVKRQSVAAIIGAIPIILFHGVVSWQKIIYVSWFFYVQAFCFLELRANNFPIKKTFTFIYTIHAVNNILLIIIIQFMDML